MSYFTPATSAIGALTFVVVEWSVQLLMISCPFTHSRTPSSETVLNVKFPVTGACTCPVHRTEKLSPGIPAPGAPPPQLKFTVGETPSASSPTW